MFTTANNHSNLKTFLSCLPCSTAFVPEQPASDKTNTPRLHMLCTSLLIYKEQLCLDYHQHFDMMSKYPWLTKNWINWDIDHPASATNVSTYLIVSSYAYDLSNSFVSDCQCLMVTSQLMTPTWQPALQLMSDNSTWTKINAIRQCQHNPS